MKFYLISDNIDTLMGLRLSGIEGVVVHEKHEVRNELQKALGDKDIAIILITQRLMGESSELIFELKRNRKYPLIVEIPDRHGSSHISTSISQYVHEAIGIRI